ncbi:hypothetical protein DSL72_002794 [Monilinia vaccinii-corymbosi]|uniref:Uncharacterized protein n=1 Tax=Monilinia vaccinii-corymbosi TaxID=61207 RepID=A0A8A3PDM4_9HELO|nr:hypothetical protein DSL72_002794 [Monilinia vaccinii-corymbosi]
MVVYFHVPLTGMGFGFCKREKRLRKLWLASQYNVDEGKMKEGVASMSENVCFSEGSSRVHPGETIDQGYDWVK